MLLDIKENGINVVLDITEGRFVRLLHFSTKAFKNDLEEKHAAARKLVEIQVSGYSHTAHHGGKHNYTSPGNLLIYKSHSDTVNEIGRKLEIIQTHQNLVVKSIMQFYGKTNVVRSYTEVEVLHDEKYKDETYPLEYVSSFTYVGIGEKRPSFGSHNVYLPHNSWFGEAQWKKYTPHDLGYDIVIFSSVKSFGAHITGNWSTAGYLPMGCYESNETNETMMWQIETNSSWRWEIGDTEAQMQLQLSGPTYKDNGFCKILKAGDTFTSIPCAITLVDGMFEEAVTEITKYRRLLRRPNKDNEFPKVIFNDYMNCLFGDPTTEKLFPLIDAAADSGCEYFCIDCGWYDDGPWWDGVGEWLPAKGRFPNGIVEPINYIREKGMIPGLWLELEVMGINCELAKKVPDSWFFKRNGKVLIDENRYQLDYRNEEVRNHATSVIKRLVEEYGVGYIKMDYNINMGVGTDVDADSAGEGLLEHCRAYLAWLDSIFETYPDLVIENCGSGGMRMDYALLARHSIQSVTDQEDYLKMSAIAANTMAGVTPEQAAIWSYPLRDGDEEEVIFNMVNAILMRIHQSGHLAEISKERFKYVKEGIEYHKSICNELNTGFPFWPIGLATLEEPYRAVGVDCGKNLYIAVWRVDGGEESVALPIRNISGKNAKASLTYPIDSTNKWSFDANDCVLSVQLEEKTARIFKIELQ